MTAQVRDILIYNNEGFYMAAEPLKPYLETVQLPHKLVAPNTSCWRGYWSHWAIENKKLFLVKWEGYILDGVTVGMHYLFPDEEIVFAKWFTGEIRIGLGKLIRYVHGGYESLHEGDRFLIFENGLLVNDYSIWRTKEEVEKIIKEEEDLPF